MATDTTGPVARLWRCVKSILIDWTVTPRMLALNEERPFLYQLVTTPILALVFGFLVAGAIVVALSLLGMGPFPPKADDVLR